MASDDIYLRKDVYEADQRALIAEIKLGNNELLKAVREFREEINGRIDQTDRKIEQVRTELNGRIDQTDRKIEQVRVELHGEIVQLRHDTESRFDKLEARVEVLSGRIASLETFVTASTTFITLLIGLAVFIMPISRALRKFWTPKPQITLEQIEALIDRKLEARN